MTRTTGFESLEKVKKIYPYFDLEQRSFSRGNGEKNRGGIPMMYDGESRRVYMDDSDTHSLVYGATGSLKTRTIVSPGIKILGHAGESMIINDPKGELFSRHAGDLKKQGYHIVEINFRDPALGNSWNPLYIPYQFYLAGDMDKASEFINDIATNLMVSDRSTDDPFWDFSASDLLYGLIQLLFRYCKDHELPTSAVNIGNLLALRRALFGKGQAAQFSPLWKYGSEDELVAASLSGSIYAPKDTMNSILSVFDQKMRTFSIQPALLDMLANNDFDIADIGWKKTAVFLITPDEKTSYHRLVSMFVKESYEYLIYLAAETADNKVANRLNYILDEFSSLPKIADMPAMISAARSRDIRFLLVVQSHAALKQRYGEDAETIVSNCTNWIFFTSRELDLLKQLSELCGTQKNNTPNISVYDLQHLSKERREALVLAGRLRPLQVNMLDIDRFGDKSYVLLEHERHQRLERVKLNFELKQEIRDRLFQVVEDARGTNPIDAKLAGLKEEADRSRTRGNRIDVDAMIRDVKLKIAELEKAQEAEKDQNAKQEKMMESAVKDIKLFTDAKLEKLMRRIEKRIAELPKEDETGAKDEKGE